MPRYSAILMDHFNHPRNAGLMDSPDVIGKSSIGGRSPHMTVYLQVHEESIVKAMFTTFGCGVTIAAGSVLTEMIEGRDVRSSLEITGEEIVAALGGVPKDKQFCTNLAIDALHDAVAKI